MISYIYQFGSIAPGQTVSLFIHGYSEREVVNYNIVIYNVDIPTLNPEVRASLTQGETFRWHVDGSTARKLYITNLEPSSTIEAAVIEWKESF